MGPWAYVQHLASGPRLPFTAAYFGSIALTLYFSLGVSHYSCPCAAAYTNPGILRLAPQYYFDTLLRYRTTSMPCLVSSQLLPYGIQRPPYCQHLWSEKSRSLDDGIDSCAINESPARQGMNKRKFSKSYNCILHRIVHLLSIPGSHPAAIIGPSLQVGLSHTKECMIYSLHIFFFYMVDCAIRISSFHIIHKYLGETIFPSNYISSAPLSASRSVIRANRSLLQWTGNRRSLERYLCPERTEHP